MHNKEIYIAVAGLLVLVLAGIFITRATLLQAKSDTPDESPQAPRLMQSFDDDQIPVADRYKAQQVCIEASKDRMAEQAYEVKTIILDKRSSRYRPSEKTWLLFTDMETTASDGTYVAKGSRCLVLSGSNELVDFSVFDT